MMKKHASVIFFRQGLKEKINFLGGIGYDINYDINYNQSRWCKLENVISSLGNAISEIAPMQTYPNKLQFSTRQQF